MKDILAQMKPPALKNPAPQQKTFIHVFLFLWVILPRIRIRIQPTKINTDTCGSGSTTLRVMQTTTWNVAFVSTSMGFCLIPAYNVLEQFPNLREEK
jgi:hypothetical protein